MSKLIKKNSFCSLYLSFILFFSFCSKKIETNTNVFRYNEYRNITSLDPAFSRNPQNIWPVNQIFNGLVQLDDLLHLAEIANKNKSILVTTKKDMVRIPKNFRALVKTIDGFIELDDEKLLLEILSNLIENKINQ